MYFLIYSSYTSIQFSDNDLKALLKQSRENNKKSGISGMLLFLGWQFLQLLEGEEEAVKNLYNAICKDERHKSIVLLDEGYTEDRIFPDWYMGFNTASSNEMLAEEGYSKLNSSSALQLLKRLS